MSDYSNAISSTEEIIEDARNGRMFILVDHEDRENEGDLVIPAQMCTPSAINFMATHGRGLICLALPGSRIDALGLPLMSPKNSSRHETAFTLSIEAREGVTTGISAADRAWTVSVAIDPTKGAADIATPGHIFPLKARDGGVLIRAGHTEAAVDVSRLAGLNPSGVICEIMNDDGTMARLPDLISFAQRHGLKIGTISDLIAYRRRHDNLITEKAVKSVQSTHGGDWLMRVFADETHGDEHVVLSKGDLSAPGPGRRRRRRTAGRDADHRGGRPRRGGPAPRHDDEDGRSGRAFAANAAAIRGGGADPVGAGIVGDHAGDKLCRAPFRRAGCLRPDHCGHPPDQGVIRWPEPRRITPCRCRRLTSR